MLDHWSQCKAFVFNRVKKMRVWFLAFCASLFWRLAVWFYRFSNQIQDLHDAIYWRSREDEADMLQELIGEINFVPKQIQKKKRRASTKGQ